MFILLAWENFDKKASERPCYHTDKMGILKYLRLNIFKEIGKAT